MKVCIQRHIPAAEGLFLFLFDVDILKLVCTQSKNEYAEIFGEKFWVFSFTCKIIPVMRKRYYCENRIRVSGANICCFFKSVL